MNLDRLKPLAGADVAGKRVLLRADLNVPVAEGRVSDKTRLERLVPGLAALAGRGARVVLVSHFGRPEGPDAAKSFRGLAGRNGAGYLGGWPKSTCQPGSPANGPSSPSLPASTPVRSHPQFAT